MQLKFTPTTGRLHLTIYDSGLSVTFLARLIPMEILQCELPSMRDKAGKKKHIIFINHHFSRLSASRLCGAIKNRFGQQNTSDLVHSQQLALIICCFLRIKYTISINISLYIMAGIVWAC